MNSKYLMMFSPKEPHDRDDFFRVKTSADIIKEAKQSIAKDKNENGYKNGAVKPVNTLRPFTPLDGQRILFGKKTKTSRPPSTFSLRYLQFENLKLAKPPDDASINREENGTMPKLKLPMVQNGCITKRVKSSNSLEHLPEECELKLDRKTYLTRNAYSSPLEATNSWTTPMLYFQSDIDFVIKQSPQLSRKIFSGTPRFQKRRDAMETLAVLNGNEFLQDAELLENLNLLYECLDYEYYSRSKRVSSKTKAEVIKALYKFVETKNAAILAAIARNVLALGVTGSNLAGVCKLIFKISREDKNDALFLDNNILDLFVEGLGWANPLKDCEALIYGYGALRFLTLNSDLTEKIFKLGALHLTVLHIQIINNARLEKLTICEPTHHVLFQLTGVVRNLAASETCYDVFISSQAIKQICLTMNLFINDLDIISNIARILSAISIDDNCCKEIVENEYILSVMVNVLEKYPGKQDIVVRLGYTLGNILAKFDHARLKFYSIKNSTNNLLSIIEIYMRKEKRSKPSTFNEMGSNGSVDDVLVKIIRVLANLAMSPSIGSDLVLKHGIKLINLFIKLLSKSDMENSYELVMSILSTLNNLSFYYSPDQRNNAFNDTQIYLCKEFDKILRYPNIECAIEVVLVMGNLSRSKSTRDYIVSSGILEVLVAFLNKNEIELIKATMGVFINLMADKTARHWFAQHDVITSILDVFERIGHHDWSLSNYICQLLWNYSLESNSRNILDSFTNSNVNLLVKLLVDYLDEEKIFGITEECSHDISDILSSDDYIQWEEFATVATNLLEKIDFYLDNNQT